MAFDAALLSAALPALADDMSDRRRPKRTVLNLEDTPRKYAVRIIGTHPNNTFGGEMGTFRQFGAVCTAIISLLGSVAALAQPGDLTQLSVTEAAKLIKEGRVTSEQLTRAEIGRASCRERVFGYV